MEISENINETVRLDLKKRTDLYVANNITIENFRWHYNTRRDAMTPLTIRTFKQLCPKLETVDPKEPTEDQKRVLLETFSLQAATAISQIHDGKAAVSTENIISLSLMSNQMRRFDVGFFGGDVPTYKFCKIAGRDDFEEKGDDEIKEKKQDFLGQIRVVSGVPVFGAAICTQFKDMGFKTITPVTAASVNTGVIVAVTMKFNTENNCIPHPFIPTKLGVPGCERQMLQTSFASLAMENFKHKPASVYQIVADMAKKADVLDRIFKAYGPGELGVPVSRVQATPVIGGMGLTDNPRSLLISWHTAGLQQMGKARQLVKDCDTGFKAMNAPMKWKFPLDIVHDMFTEVSPVIALYGAAGGRARRLFENKGRIVAYDLKESPVPTKKVSEYDFEKYKIDRWVVRDIFQHDSFEEDAFVSDIFIDTWKRKNIDADGHKFVSGVLRGHIINDSVITCKKLPAVRAIKGFIPNVDQVKLYDGTYPFAAFRVCRPITKEVIYVSVGTEDLNVKLQLAVQSIVEQNPVTLENRVFWITNATDFEDFLKLTTVCICEELNFQQRKMALDPRIVIASPHNRKWGLDPEELPCLFVPKHMRMGAVNSIDMNSSLFGKIVEHEQWTDNDFEDHAQVERELEADQPLERRVRPKGEVVNFDDDNE